MTSPAPAVTDAESASRIDMGHGWSFEPEPLLDGYLHLYREGYGVVGRNTIFKQEDARRIAAAARPCEDGGRLEDLARLLRALGLSDHARPVSPAEVFDACLRDIEGLRQRIPDAEADALRLHREKMGWMECAVATKAEVERLRTRIAILEEALWPFAIEGASDPHLMVRDRMGVVSRCDLVQEDFWRAVEAFDLVPGQDVGHQDGPNEAMRGATDNLIARVRAGAMREANPPMPPEILALLPGIAEGEVQALPFLYDRGPPGPDWFLAGGEPIPGNLGGDFDEADAKFAAFAWNRTRTQIALQQNNEID